MFIQKSSIRIRTSQNLYSKDKDFSGGCHGVLVLSVVRNCQPDLMLTKEDIELHFNINMIGIRGVRRVAS